ncbi:hypothetical protein QQF64_034484 [Cirrhinus molitorella]|uniref:Immunoglobulin V-set domain-containing protein n=1 Tax=Cirrhinus molitorella TaxID=172907 RepID=A0ABR3L2D3_9TELE
MAAYAKTNTFYISVWFCLILIQISDDGRRSFTVLMTGLRLADSGWYFCSAGETVNPVHVQVTWHMEHFCLA